MIVHIKYKNKIQSISDFRLMQFSNAKKTP